MSAEAVPSSDLDGLCRAYVEAVLAPDARGARRLIDDATDGGIPAHRIYLEVLQPALHEVGRRWESATITVAHEHLATQITQAVLARLAAQLAPGEGGEGRTVLVACSPGERHVLGGQMVADFLEADGWTVLQLGGDTPIEAITEFVEHQGIPIVALSTALPSHALATSAVCAALKRLDPAPLIVVGGQGFGGDRQRALATGADAYAADPAELLRILHARPA